MKNWIFGGFRKYLYKTSVNRKFPFVCGLCRTGFITTRGEQTCVLSFILYKGGLKITIENSKEKDLKWENDDFSVSEHQIKMRKSLCLLELNNWRNYSSYRASQKKDVALPFVLIVQTFIVKIKKNIIESWIICSRGEQWVVKYFGGLPGAEIFQFSFFIPPNFRVDF